MRLLYFLFLYVLLLLSVFPGCSGTAKTNNHLVSGQDNDSKFPAFLVGTWQAEDIKNNIKWQFTFDPNGSIVTMKHYFISTPITVADGGTYEQLKDTSSGTYVLGPQEVIYDHSKRQLKVIITIDYFYLNLPIGIIEGTMLDRLEGLVLPDGKKWEADWYSHIQFTEAEKVEPPTSPLKQLVFVKVPKNQE
jgi:hypothetical protein